MTNPFSAPNTHFTSEKGVEIYYYYSITFNFILEYITFDHTLFVGENSAVPITEATSLERTQAQILILHRLPVG